MKLSAWNLILIASLAPSCGGDAACVPGEQVECACPGGVTGAQACNADGTGFEGCSCDGTNPSAGGGSSGPPPDPCEAFGLLAAARVEECDLEVNGGASQGGASPCDAEAQATAQCLTPCLQDVSCAALNGDDLDGLEAYADCVGACAD